MPAVLPGLRGALGALGALAALALPATCAGCGHLDTPWCAACAAEVAAAVRSGRGRHSPTPRPSGSPATWTAGPYAGALAAALIAYKDQGRRDLAPMLARLLALPVDDALAGTGTSRGRPVLVVPVPSSRAARRRRGDVPLEPLALTALAVAEGGPGCRFAPLLRLRRRVADQAPLHAAARATNVAGAMRPGPAAGPQIAGATCLLVDDVVTSGATLAEAARALRTAGAARVLAATVAATLRTPFSPNQVPSGPGVV